MFLQSVTNWGFALIGGFASFGDFLNMNIGVQGLTFFGLLTVGGLITYLGVAIVKWLIS